MHLVSLKMQKTLEYPFLQEYKQSVQFSSVAQSCPTLYDPMIAARQASLSITNSRRLLKVMSIRLVMSSNHLNLCHPFSFCFFSSESVLRIRWPKYWSFSISSSNEYSELISFRINWFDLPAVQGIFKSFFQHHSSNHQCFGTQPSLWSKSHIHTWLLEKL